jgi:crotonobetainyl-CoA:carnitine CoA-transferase CaiB-like acyl-CoA transferase
MDSTATDLAGWAASGAMALTGPADGAPSPLPSGLAAAAAAAAHDLANHSARWGRPVVVDGAALLGERAAISGMVRQGSVSVGGAARFVKAADGWFALNLPRPEDVAALPALISRDVAPDDWPSIEFGLREMTLDAVVAQATLLGMAVGVVTTGPRPISPARELARGGPRRPVSAPLVVDLTSLWAGPLAGSLLGRAGARVIKVEGRTRPDGARGGASAFYDLLNNGKESLALDLGVPADVGLLHRIVAAADLVLEGSRPRAMDALGIDPVAVARRGTSWISLTGHGRTGPGATRIGFGDDAAVTGGLVLAGSPPMFVGDAVADPLAGLVAAAFGAELLGSGRAAVVDVSLARVSAWAASTPTPAPVHLHDGEWIVEIEGDQVSVALPRHRPIPASAPPFGAHSGALRAEFGDGAGDPPG